MLHPETDRVSFSTFTVLLYIVFFIPCVGVEFELISSDQPIIALAGDDVILPCHLRPSIRASYVTVMWTKPGLIPEYVHFHQDGQLLLETQNPSYFLRTGLFMDELLRGNVSIKIFKVKISDAGRYICKLPSMRKEVPVQLIVGAVCTPFIEVVTNNSEHAVLQCESTGWYPEPEVFWLDGEGNLLSAGPTETVRGPDDLYTVSSRVTVEKRHSNSFTCRVQQSSTNQTREAQIHVPADFVTVQPSSHSIWIVLIVSSVCIILIIIMFMTGFFFCWNTDIVKRWRKRRRREETEVELQSKQEDQNDSVENERESLSGPKKQLKQQEESEEDGGSEEQEQQLQVDLPAGIKGPESPDMSHSDNPI